MANEKDTLRREYIALIGYDPFEDDPTLSVSVVRDVLADYKRTFVDADDVLPGERPRIEAYRNKDGATRYGVKVN